MEGDRDRLKAKLGELEYEWVEMSEDQVARMANLFFRGKISEWLVEDYSYVGIYYKYCVKNLGQAVEIWRRGAKVGCNYCQYELGVYYLDDLKSTTAGIYYLMNSSTFGNFWADIRLIQHFWAKQEHQLLVDFCQERIKTKNPLLQVCIQVHLTAYYQIIQPDEAQMKFHGRLGIQLGANPSILGDWYLKNPSVEAFTFALKHQLRPLRDLCLTTLPPTVEYMHLLLSVSSGDLSTSQRFLKRAYLEMLFSLYRYSPTYLSSPVHCVPDVVRLIRQSFED